ncbi:helicase [Cellulomonas hominis]|uniref:Helicase n=2 Tax=Cellulomonas hominis TaxID=156981 RepID=A0A511FD54_9CELL|nr:AAA family ATPase [Cellulomonas hominis]NKY06261.1 AAA family ATPase [Cellulomonas hominis]GEL47176.1 helicase [Cellulomonas hominis]
MTDATPRPFPDGTPQAASLRDLLAGHPAVLCDSPPGAGKSTMVAKVVSWLHTHTDATVAVATFTNEQGTAIAAAISHELGVDGRGLPQVQVASRNMAVPAGAAAPGARTGSNPVTVRTVASCKINPPDVDVMVFDEAYQVTFADFSKAADRAEQVLLVGDPGQIGPVIAFNVGAWSHLRQAPQMRAPEVLAARNGVARHSLQHTYRLGPDTAAAIAPLYPFTFDSARPERHLDGLDGEIACVLVPERPDPYDLATMRSVARAATDYVGRVLVERDENGRPRTRPLGQDDVAIVVSRNAQASALEALLLEAGVPGITVGTADRLQGGQWHAVVAVDPTLSGAESEHALSSGRLCVMTSRHMTHLTWVYDPGWEDVLEQASDPEDAGRAASVRAALVTYPHR